jgi:Na+/melibiose symporter-like transporter
VTFLDFIRRSSNQMASPATEDVVESQPEQETTQIEPQTTLNFFEKIGYALGHIFNDLVAGVWYSYTLIFLQGVQSMPGPEAGAMVMLGQVADAISTPIVGFLTDKFGTKKSWHIFGSFLVLLSFPMIFSICPFCETWPTWWKFLYYPFVIIIFQFGWPVCQITHLAMIPELSRTQRDRSDLTALRYSAMIVSVVTVFCVTWAVLDSGTIKDASITPSDGLKFRVRLD